MKMSGEKEWNRKSAKVSSLLLHFSSDIFIGKKEAMPDVSPKS